MLLSPLRCRSSQPTLDCLHVPTCDGGGQGGIDGGAPEDAKVEEEGLGR